MHEASGFSYGSIVITMWIWATLYQIAYIDQVFFPPEEHLSQQVIYIDRCLALALIYTWHAIYHSLHYLNHIFNRL